MTAQLYRWPAAAKFGRVVPKTKFYEHGTVSASVREKFVSEIQRITWSYKLADATIHLLGNASVPEIQVFSIDAKGEDVSNGALTALDKAVPSPIIFEINRGDGEKAQTRMVASHKQFGGTTPRLSAYLTTDWLPADEQRAALPPALDLLGLYTALLMPMLRIATSPGEGLSEATGRMEQVRKIERDIAALEKKLRTEPQLNRKVELRRQLNRCAAALDILTAPEPPKTKDAPWTN